MSEVDDRVVQMRFDNAQFEAGVQQTLQSLNKLNKSIDENTKANNGKSLKGLTNAVTSMSSDFNRMDKTADVVSRKFSIFGTIGDQVLRRIADGAVNTTKKLLSMVNSPLEQIKNGGWTRASNINNARFQLNGLKIAWDSVNKDLQYAVNQTAYGLDSAANVASQLAASGITIRDNIQLTADNVDELAQKFKGMSAKTLIANGSLDEMSVALRAISGVAAQTNSSYDDIGNVFARVAGQGRVMATDLNSLAARGMNAAATLGQALGKSESEIRDMVSKGQISFEIFSEAMYDAFADHAIDANNTFSGALANMKAALSKIGAEFFLPFLEEIPPVINEIRESINKLKSALMPVIGFVNQVVKKVLEDATAILATFKESSIIPNIVQAIVNSFFGLGQIIAPIVEAFSKVFSTNVIANAEQFSNMLVNVTNGFVLSDEKANKIKMTFEGLFTVLKAIGTISKNIFGKLSKLVISVAKNVIVLSGNISDFAHKLSLPGQPLDSLRIIFEKVGKAASEFKENLIEGFNKIGELPGIQKLSKSISEFKRVIVDPAISKAVKTFGKFASEFNIKLPNVNSVIDFVDKVASKLADLINKIIDVKKNIKSSSKDISNGFSVFTSIKNSVCGAIDTIKNAISSLLSSIKSLKPVTNIGDSALSGLKNGFIGVVSSIANSNKTISVASNGITSVMEYIQSFFATFSSWIGKINLTIQQVGTSIGGALSSISFGAGALGMALQSYNKVDPSKLLKTAIAVGILALSAVALASIPKDHIVTAIVGIAAAFGILAIGLQFLFKQINSGAKVTDIKHGLFNSIYSIVDTFINGEKNAAKIKAVGNVLIEFAAAIAILSASVYALGQLSSDRLIGGLSGVVVLLIASYQIIKKLVNLASNLKIKEANNITVMATSLIIISLALKSLSNSVKSLGSLADKPEELIIGLAGVLTLLASMIVVSDRLASIKTGVGSIIAAGAGMVIIASAIQLLSSAVMNLGSLKLTELGLGLLGVVASLSALVLAAKQLEKFAGGKSLVGATSILILSVALNALVIPIKALSSLSFTGMLQGLAGIAMALGTLIGLSAIIGKFPAIIVGLASLAVTLIPLAAGITALIIPITALGALPIGSLIKGVGGFAVALGSLVLLGSLAQTCAIGLIALGGAVLLIGTGALAAGAGVLMFSAGLNGIGVAIASLAAILPAQINSAIMSFTTFISGILTAIASIGGALTAAITTIISSIIEAIVQNIENIIDAESRILDASLELISKYVPKIVEVVVSAITAILQTLSNHIQDFVEAGMKFLIGLNEGFASQIGDLVQSAWDVAIAYINALADGIENNKQALEDAFRHLIKAIIDFLFGDGASDFLKSGIELVGNLASGVLDGAEDVYSAFNDIITDTLNGIGDFVKNFIEAGVDLVSGFVSGLTSNDSKSKAAGAGAELGKAAEDGTRKQTKTHSPSKVFKEIGNDCAAGFSDVKDNKKTVENAYASLGQAAIDGTSGAIDKGKKYLNDKITDLVNSSIPADSFINRYGSAFDLFSTDSTTSTNGAAPAIDTTTAVIDANTDAKTANAKASSKAGKATKELSEEEKVLAKFMKYSTLTIEQYMNSVANALDIIGDTTPQDAAKAAVNELAEAIYQASKETDDSVSETSEKAEDHAQNVMKAFNEAFENVKKSAKDALDYFSSFDKKIADKIKPKEMIANFKSQEEGISDFYQNIGILAAKGLTFGFVKSLMEEGPSAYSKVAGLLDATSDEIAKLNEQWNSKESIANKSAAMAMTALMTSMQITKLRDVDAQRKKSVTAANEALKSYKEKIKEAQDAGLDMEETLKMVQDQAADTGETIEASGPSEELITSYNDLQKAMMDAGLSNEELQTAMLNDDGFEFTENSTLKLIDRINELSVVVQKFKDFGSEISDNVKSQLSSSISYFDEWNDKYELTGEKLMQNVESQIAGIAKYNDNIQTIIEHGGGEIVAMFGDKITPEIANAMAQLGNSALDTLQQKLTYLQQAPLAAGAAAKESWYKYGQINGMALTDALTELSQSQTLLAQGSEIGQNVSQGAINGMQQSQSAVNTAGQAVGQAAINGVATGAQTHSPSVATTTMGNNIDQGLINGMQTMLDSVTTQGRNTGMAAINAIKSGIMIQRGSLITLVRAVINQTVTTFRSGLAASVFQPIGQQICNGLVAGINDGRSGVINAAVDVAVSSYEAACAALEVHSPSRKMRWVGQMFDAGMAGGIEDGADSITDTATQTMHSALQTAVDLLNSTGDMNPTIKPVLDLSDVQNGSKLLSSAFNNIGPMSVGANIGHITTNAERMNNLMQGAKMGNTNSFGDTNLYVYGAQGQDVNQLAKIVIKKLDNEYARRKAAWT